jgi:predicted dehydrogenase
MTYRVIHVGTGGWGKSWCERFLPPNINDGLIEVVAAVDMNPQALLNAQQALGLRPEQCFTDIQQAFEQVPADFCTIVVPPAHHEAVVDLAVAHHMHILSEKPIADTLEGSIRIAEKVRRAGVKMAVTMSHRFDQDKSTLRHALRADGARPLDYLMMRFTCDARRFGTWGHFRHEIADTLMIEGAVHHLDILADLAGAPCEHLYAETWNPAWGEYGGDSQGLVMMRFSNGVRAVYEGAKTNAIGLNGWAQEYIRVEGRDATLILDQRRLEQFVYQPSERWRTAAAGTGKAIPLLEQSKWANAWLIEQFVHWLDGGPPMATNVEANLQSVALVFAAIESSRTGIPVRVQEMLAEARNRVVAALEHQG